MKKKTIVFIFIFIIIVIAFFVWDNQIHNPHIKSVEEAQSELEKAQQDRIQAELDYINAVDNYEKAHKTLKEKEN